MSGVTGREAGMPALLNAATTSVAFHAPFRPLVCSSRLWTVTDANPGLTGPPPIALRLRMSWTLRAGSRNSSSSWKTARAVTTFYTLASRKKVVGCTIGQSGSARV
jgi:hypothetical protein